MRGSARVGARRGGADNSGAEDVVATVVVGAADVVVVLVAIVVVVNGDVAGSPTTTRVYCLPPTCSMRPSRKERGRTACLTTTPKRLAIVALGPKQA